MKFAAPNQLETSLKLPIGHQDQIRSPRQDSEGNMGKFNWRANWEILLVFVIIIIGIVITTIAAIRSRDKHLLVTPAGESTGGFGGGIVEFSSAGQVPALPQTDFQLPNRPEEFGADGDEQSQPGLASLLVSTTRVPLPAAGIHRDDRERGHPNRLQESHLARNHKRLASSNSGLDSNRPMRSSGQQKGYETTAQSGEQSNPQQQQQKQFFRQFAAGQDEPSKHETRHRDRASEQLDYESQKMQSEAGSGGERGKVPEQQQQLLQIMPGPYELAATLQNNQLLHAVKPKSPAKIEQQSLAASQSPPMPPSDSTEELMTSYTRVPPSPSRNLSEPLGVDSLQFNRDASNNSSDSDSNQPASELVLNRPPPPPPPSASVHDYNQRPVLYQHRHLPSNLPIEMLLGELIKLTPQPTPQPLIDSTASLEQPANSRPQMGILQQLRSLPGPLMALFQQQTGANQQNSASPRPSNTAELHLNQQRIPADIYTNFMHQLQQQAPNNDASESAQHYQRLSMSPYHELESVVARSLRATNPLPAFPPPKGVPQTWVPPNMGGLSILQEDASNNNADFVASETAGFVRGLTGNSQDIGGLQAAASEQINQKAIGDNNASQNSQNNQNQQQQLPANTDQNNLLNGNANKPQSAPISSGAHQNSVLQQQQQQQQNTNQAPNLNHIEKSVVASGQLRSNPIQTASLQQGQHLVNPQIRRLDGAQSMRTGVPSAIPMGSQLNKLPGQSAQALSPAAGRVKRSTRTTQAEGDDVDEPEEYSDSTPVSIVTPDGRPLSSMQNRRIGPSSFPGSRQLDQASSQRETKHADLGDESPLAHHLGARPKLPQHDNDDNDDDAQHRIRPKRRPTKVSRKRMTTANKAQKLETADSLLMSKLLGVASTNDELEDDLDGDDEDSARERRKEELEDAEFGITNDERSSGPTMNMDDLSGTNQADNHEVTRLSKAANSDSEQPSMGSAGSTEDGAYARRQNQQRSDVEFYGHPGEETRQLKYGILGSGNYEVVNGGIYPDHDESTAAVNSVANYVRRPSDVGGGGHLLLGGLPKLIGSMAAAAAASDDGRLAGRPRLGAPGFMWGASSTGPIGSELGSLYNHIETPDSGNTLTSNPLLAMLDHSENLPHKDHTSAFYASDLVASHQMGSSGSSARSTHLSREPQSTSQRDSGEANPNGRLKAKRRRPSEQANAQDDQGYSSGDNSSNPSVSGGQLRGRGKLDQMTTLETLNGANNHIRSTSGSGADSDASHKKNPFRSYHISPSKKITIFSDQDLDSAPSDPVGQNARVDETKDKPIIGSNSLR